MDGAHFAEADTFPEMRIALVVERFEPAAGGVEQVVWRLAQGLAEAGDEVHVLASRAAPSACARVHPLPVPRFWQPARVLAFSRAASRTLARERFDVVHSFTRTLHQDVFHAGGGCHADYMRSSYGPRGARARRMSPRHALLLELERRIFAAPDQVVQCVSRMVRDAIARRFGVADAKLALIPNGVDVERFRPGRPTAERRLERARHGAGEDAVWLLVGSGWRRKGLDTALRAIAASRDRGAQLWVAGRDAPAAWRRRAERLGIAQRVHFLGVRADMERVYAAADGLLLPTRYDAFGLVCLEAAACGLPVVTSGQAGAAELLPEASRVVADPNDAAGFARVLEALADAPLRARLGERGRRAALACDWPSCTRALRALYGQVRR